MEQDQEDFERDQRASNNIAENLDFFSNDDDLGLPNLVHDPVPTSSTPLPESANPNLELADLSFLDEFKDIDFFFGPSELPAPTQTTSSMPVLQSGSPTEDEQFNLLNLNADASYTDHHAPESLAPIATANLVPATQSLDFAEDSMLPFDDMDLDAPYTNIDLSQSLAPTITTGLVQAAQSAEFMEDGTSRIIELDPDPVMASSGPAPTSSEQLPPPASTDRVFAAEVAQSADSMTNFNGSGPPNPSYLTSQPQHFAFPSNEMSTTMPTPGKQLRPKSGNSFPSGVHVPIQPKPAALSRSTELASTREPQDSSLSQAPSERTLTSCPASLVTKSKRKRPRSPHPHPSDIPKGVPEERLHTFQTTETSGAAKEEQQLQPVAKRMRSDKVCLRCQISKEKVGHRCTLRRVGWAYKNAVFGSFPL